MENTTSPKDEAEMMRQATAFLSYHANPPPVDSPESDEWWILTMSEANELYNAWNGHTLFSNVLFALIDYIESKVRKQVNENNEIQEL